jgi:hypothetical protein
MKSIGVLCFIPLKNDEDHFHIVVIVRCIYGCRMDYVNELGLRLCRVSGV